MKPAPSPETRGCGSMWRCSPACDLFCFDILCIQLLFPSDISPSCPKPCPETYCCFFVFVWLCLRLCLDLCLCFFFSIVVSITVTVVALSAILPICLPEIFHCFASFSLYSLSIQLLQANLAHPQRKTEQSMCRSRSESTKGS